MGNLKQLLSSPLFYSHWGLLLLNQRGRAEEYLMLPALLGEKLASRLLLTVVGLPLFWTLWTTLIGAVEVVLGFNSTFYNPFEFWGVWEVVLCIAYYTYCLWYSVWYSSPWGFKATLHSASIIILLIAPPLISAYVLGYFLGPEIQRSLNVAVFFLAFVQSDSLLLESISISGILALAAFFVYLTYLRMRETEA